ncbi:hypothetical protein GCM10008967_37850 [Bacillus carboniphilus]|uniref:Uridine kinase n=1 Tax=Bacillus carboniphilus TaxID=86663 RepID=A0ABN0WQ16_9BACI
MIAKNRPFVIAIAAVSGGGKTTMVKQLNGKMKNTKALYFDEYNFNGPTDIVRWVENGPDYNAWDLSPLRRDIEGLLSEPLDYILLDYPFAYQNSQISSLIDFAFFIDTPLDIALARRMIRDFANQSNQEILIEMENYVSKGRQGYLEMLKTIKPNSELVVDGMLPSDELANVMSEIILNKFKR